jgi:receptor expression-enhancing protein 5/6
MSFKALRSPGDTDDKQWLTYWIVFSFFTVFDSVLAYVLFFLPFFYLIKMGLYVYLMHPKFKGALNIYSSFVEPLLIKYEGKIDESL